MWVFQLLGAMIIVDFQVSSRHSVIDEKDKDKVYSGTSFFF